MNPTGSEQTKPVELCAVVLTLAPLRAGTFPANQSRAVHAWFLRLVAGADPDLAARLHDEAQVKPFTCSNLWRSGRRSGEEYSPPVVGPLIGNPLAFGKGAVADGITEPLRGMRTLTEE
jgi:hypothetical protein